MTVNHFVIIPLKCFFYGLHSTDVDRVCNDIDIGGQYSILVLNTNNWYRRYWNQFADTDTDTDTDRRHRRYDETEKR